VQLSIIFKKILKIIIYVIILMNKPILALFSLLFVASAYCIDISSDEEFAPVSGSNNVPKATPASAFRPTRPNSIKEDNVGRVHNARKFEFVDDDEDFLDDLDDDEEFIVKPSASITSKPPPSKPVGAFKPKSGTGNHKRHHTNEVCFTNCLNGTPHYCRKISSDMYNEMDQTKKNKCSSLCMVSDFC